MPVYVGGDDLLAFTPAASALGAARACRAVGYLRRSGASAVSIQPWGVSDAGDTAGLFGIFARGQENRLSPRLALSRLARKYKMLGTPALALPNGAADAAVAASPAWTANEVMGPCLVPMGGQDQELAERARRIADDALGWDSVFGPFADKLREDLIVAGSVLLSRCGSSRIQVQPQPAGSSRCNPSGVKQRLLYVTAT